MKVFMDRIERAVILLTLMAFVRSAHGAGELEGQIRGRIAEAATDVPIPGATVTATSPNLGYPRVVTSDEAGEFLIPGLPIGSYTVTVSYAGVKPITRKVLVQPGITSPLNIQWSVEMAEVETTTIIEERPVTNPGSSQIGAVVSFDLQRHTPGVHANYYDSLQQVPGVRRGTQGEQFEPLINGARETDTRYFLDGLEVTDAVTRFSTTKVPIEGIDSIQVITGGFDAEYNSFGGVINTITREGSDDWHGRASVYVRNSALSRAPPTGSGPGEGARPFDTRPLDISYNSYSAINLAGPLIKHRLWFSTTFEFENDRGARRPGPQLNLPTAPPNLFKRYLGLVKVSAAPSRKHRLTFTVHADPFFHENSSGSNSRLPLYENYEQSGGWNTNLRWSVFPSSHVEFQVDFGLKHWRRNQGPLAYFETPNFDFCDIYSTPTLNLCNYDREASTHNNNAGGGSRWFQSDQTTDIDRRYTFHLDPKLTLLGHWLGEHIAKIGLQLQNIRRSRHRHTPGFYTYDDNGLLPPIAPALLDGVCDEEHNQTLGCYRRTYNYDRNTLDHGFETDLFFQDNWKLNRWLTLTPGIRFDYARTTATDGSVFSSNVAVGPRIGFVVDITRDQKTIFSSSYGRSNLVSQFDQIQSYDNALQNPAVTEEYDQNTHRWRPLPRTGGEGGFIVDKKSPYEYADQVTSSLRRQIVRNTVGQIEHVFKRQVNHRETKEINQIWDPTGFRIVGFRDGVAHTIDRLAGYDNQRYYNAFNLSIQSRPTPNWYFLTTYSLSWLWGRTVPTAPTQRKFTDGFLGGMGERTEDIRHRITASGSYMFGFGLLVGLRLDYSSGGATSKQYRTAFSNSNNRYRSPIGTDPGTCSGTYPDGTRYDTITTDCGNNVSLIAELHHPPRAIVDMNFEYDFYRFLGQHVAVSLELFNVLSMRAVTSINQNDSTSGNFGYPSGHEGSFENRLGVRWDF